MVRKVKESYCFCRKGKAGDGSGFMVACDGCEIWYHGKCVGITEHDLAPNESWYCDNCKKDFRQCLYPDCCNVAREKSKYCSDECGYKLNKMKYDKFFKPRWAQLEEEHSKGRYLSLTEMSELEKEKDEVIDTIRELKREHDELIANIAAIKSQAKELSKTNESKIEQDKEESDADRDDQEELMTRDQAKVDCVSCGAPQPVEKVFKHWASCHKKQESVYNFTSDVPIRPSCPGVDEEPHLYCQKQDKKTKRYCMNIQSACPQHTNWVIDNDEVCGCPLNLGCTPDGNYCLELKRECRLHFNWDKSRMTANNYARIQAFSKLEGLLDKINRTQMRLNDTYGGVIGVMKHITHNHAPPSTTSEDDQNNDAEMLDVC